MYSGLYFTKLSCMINKIHTVLQLQSPSQSHFQKVNIFYYIRTFL